MDELKLSQGQRLLQFITAGSNLTKVVAVNKQYRRYYYYDSERKYLYYKGSQKKLGYTPKYDLREIVDIRKGYASDIFNQLVGTYEEKCCFSIVFGTAAKPLNLVAANTHECDWWVRGLRMVLQSHQELKKTEDERVWISDYFHSIDINEDGKLDFNEIRSLLDRMSVKMSKKEALAKFEATTGVAADSDKMKDERGKPTLTLDEFIVFFHNLCERADLKEIFNRYLCIDATDRTWDCSTLMKFMIEDQKVSDITEQDCMTIISKHEMSIKNKARGALSFDGFQSLLNSKALGGIFNPMHEVVYQDMTHPLSDYFISSSHNTYLLEHQITGPSSIEGYIRALMRGCRCVELDCWDSKEGEPVVRHGRIQVISTIKFRDVIEDAISEYAFATTDYPLILSLENHCSVKQQTKMAKYLKDNLGDQLVQRIDPELTELPSPEALRGKILIKCHKLQGLVDDEVVEEGTDEEEEKLQVDGGSGTTLVKKSPSSSFAGPPPSPLLTKQKVRKVKMAKELSDLITYIQSVPFKGYNTTQAPGKFCEICSFSEKSTPKAVGHCGDFVQHSSQQLCRIYPGYWRTDSSNFNPVELWNLGAQLVSLNWQTPDKWMQVYHGRFKDNGGTGYVLKPHFMRGSDVSFNPKVIPPAGVGKIVRIKIISGCHLPKPHYNRNTKDLVDPYVKLSVFGVDDDCQEFKTENRWDNGLNPVWNETFEFFLSVPELAILRFLVKDFDKVSTGGNHDIAQYCIHFPNVLEGYRRVRLESLDGHTLGPTALCLYIRITNGQRPPHLQKAKSRTPTASGSAAHLKGKNGSTASSSSIPSPHATLSSALSCHRTAATLAIPGKQLRPP